MSTVRGEDAREFSRSSRLEWLETNGAGDGVAERDGAYHQGTVWPWLLGPFASAWLQAFGRTPATLSYCARSNAM